MSDGKESMFKDLAGFAEPTGKAVEAVRAACASLSAPWRIRREAKANADAAIIKAEGDSTAQAILQRAEHRRLDEEARRQFNLEQIMARTDRLLPDVLPEKKIDPDWIFHFTNEAQDTGNEEMQELWARLLAGELSSPGSYSRRTITFIKLLEPSDARLFAAFCQVLSNDGRAVINGASECLKKGLGLDFLALEHLDTLGLIRSVGGGMCYTSSFTLDRIPPNQRFTWVYDYHDQRIRAVFALKPDQKDVVVKTGITNLSKQGMELARLVQRSPNQAVLECIVSAVKSLNPMAEVEVVPLAAS